ncbi:MAG TPA: hypothetical protein VGM92_08320 [Candidatus Kapabacteria bacterium]|jgi:hypothetical protein
MSDKNYQRSMDALRNRAVRPPFSKMARLIERSPERVPVLFPLLPKILMPIAVVGMVTVWAFVFRGSFSSHLPREKNYTADASPHERIDAARTSSGTASPSWSAAPSAQPKVEKQEAILYKQESGRLAALSPKAGTTIALTNAETVVPGSPSSSDIIAWAEVPCSITRCTVRERALASPAERIPEPLLPSHSNAEDAGMFFATFDFAGSHQFTGNAALRQSSFTDALVGIGYRFSERSSIKMIGGEELFAVPNGTTVNSIYFKDTTIVNDSVHYQNVLGEISSANTPSTVRTYWLGASYRYTFSGATNPSPFEPFAEVLAGGAVQGVITGVSAGATLFSTYPLSFEAGAFFRALIPIGGNALTKYGGEIEMTYWW